MIIICGVPGTGKTTLCKRLEKQLGLKYENDWQILKEEAIQTFIKKWESTNIVVDVDLRNITESDLVCFDKSCKQIYILGYDGVDEGELSEKLGDEDSAKKYLSQSQKFKNICKKLGYKFYAINKNKEDSLEKLFNEIKEGFMKVADKEELLLVLDENGNSTGNFEKRSVVHSQQIYHNEIALWVINGKKVLLQRRSKNKKQFPNKLALCAGHVVGEETLLEALYKEASEEIGIDLSKYEIKPITTLKRNEPNNYCFSHHYYIKADIPVEEFKIQEEELSEVMYKDFSWFKENMKNGNEEISYRWTGEYARLFEMIEKIIEEN